MLAKPSLRANCRVSSKERNLYRFSRFSRAIPANMAVLKTTDNALDVVRSNLILCPPGQGRKLVLAHNAPLKTITDN